MARTLFRHRTNHTCHQKQNPSRATVPLCTHLTLCNSVPYVVSFLCVWLTLAYLIVFLLIKCMRYPAQFKIRKISSKIWRIALFEFLHGFQGVIVLYPFFRKKIISRSRKVRGMSLACPEGCGFVTPLSEVYKMFKLRCLCCFRISIRFRRIWM